MAEKKYNIAVLGSGPGGYVAAARAGQLGASVAIIEARELGGVCLNRGCVPTKALLESAAALDRARRGAEFGFAAEAVVPDFAAMMARKDKIVKLMRGGVESLMKRRKVDVIAGRGRLAGRGQLVVETADGKQMVNADKIILATGSEPTRLPMFKYDGNVILTSDDMLEMKEMPQSLLIIGGGYIGCEYASFFSTLGVKVTIVEMLEQLLPTSDVDVSKEILRAFKKAKIAVNLKTKVESLTVKKGSATAKLSSGEEVTADKVLIAVGRSFNSKDIGLEDAGVKTEKGAIVIDEHCQTSAAGVYAIGDVTGKTMLAHVASHMAPVAVEHALGKEARMDYRVIPSVFFTHPQVGSVGLTEQQAQAQGLKTKSAKFPMQALSKAHALGETAGFFKIIAEETTGEVVGVHIVGAEATDLIAEAALAMKLECTPDEILDTIHAHPTLAEGLMETAAVWLERPIHG